MLTDRQTDRHTGRQTHGHSMTTLTDRVFIMTLNCCDARQTDKHRVTAWPHSQMLSKNGYEARQTDT